MSETISQNYWDRYILCDYRKSGKIREHINKILNSAIIHNWDKRITFDMMMHGLPENIRAIVSTFHAITIFDVSRFAILASSISSVIECKELVHQIKKLEAEEKILDQKQTDRGISAYRKILEWLEEKFGHEIYNTSNRVPMNSQRPDIRRRVQGGSGANKESEVGSSRFLVRNQHEDTRPVSSNSLGLRRFPSLIPVQSSQDDDRHECTDVVNFKSEDQERDEMWTGRRSLVRYSKIDDLSSRTAELLRKFENEDESEEIESPTQDDEDCQNIKEELMEDDDDDDDSVTVVSVLDGNKINIIVNNEHVLVLVDSGADRSSISPNFITNRLGLTYEEEEEEDCQIAANGGELLTLGRARLMIQIGTRKKLWEFLILKELNEDLILGSDIMLSIGGILNWRNQTLSIQNAETCDVDDEEMEEEGTEEESDSTEGDDEIEGEERGEVRMTEGLNDNDVIMKAIIHWKGTKQ